MEYWSYDINNEIKNISEVEINGFNIENKKGENNEK